MLAQREIVYSRLSRSTMDQKDSNKVGGGKDFKKSLLLTIYALHLSFSLFLKNLVGHLRGEAFHGCKVEPARFEQQGRALTLRASSRLYSDSPCATYIILLFSYQTTIARHQSTDFSAKIHR